MRVAMVCSQAPPVYGGAGGQATALASHLVRRGLTVDLFTGNQLLAAQCETIDGVTIRRCPGERFVRLLPARPAELARTALFAAWLAGKLAAGRYDVYHVHGNYWFSVVPALLARFFTVPLVIKVTQLGDDDAQTVLAKRVGPVPIGAVYSLPFRFASAVIALNEEIARRHRASFPNVPVIRTTNGVEVDRFQTTSGQRARARRDLDLSDTGRVALFVGHITGRKGVQELVEAWLKFVSTRSPTALSHTLLLVGPDSGVYRHISSHTLALATSQSAKEAGIRVLRHLPRGYMPAIYAAADVFVLPTRAEGMPNSLLEALASGLPAITSKVPGVEEVVADDEESVLIEGVSAPEIAWALEDVLASDPTPQGTHRPSRLPARFAMDRLAHSYEGLYRALAAGDKRTGGRAFLDPTAAEAR